MTLITFQDGKPVLRDGKVGTEQECCCNQCGVCCEAGYEHCEITYTATFSDGNTKTETVPAFVSENAAPTQARFPWFVKGSGFSVNVYNEGCKCYAFVRVAGYYDSACEYFDPFLNATTADYIERDAYELVEIDCPGCCCSIKAVIDSGISDTGPQGNCTCGTCVKNFAGAVLPTSITIDSISCGEPECNEFP